MRAITVVAVACLLALCVAPSIAQDSPKNVNLTLKDYDGLDALILLFHIAEVNHAFDAGVADRAGAGHVSIDFWHEPFKTTLNETPFETILRDVLSLGARRTALTVFRAFTSSI